MENLIKRNNFSPEDKKILFKIDKHIKELDEKILNTEQTNQDLIKTLNTPI